MCTVGTVVLCCLNKRVNYDKPVFFCSGLCQLVHIMVLIWDKHRKIASRWSWYPTEPFNSTLIDLRLMFPPQPNFSRICDQAKFLEGFGCGPDVVTPSTQSGKTNHSLIQTDRRQQVRKMIQSVRKSQTRTQLFLLDRSSVQFSSASPSVKLWKQPNLITIIILWSNRVFESVLLTDSFQQMSPSHFFSLKLFLLFFVWVKCFVQESPVTLTTTCLILNHLDVFT